MINKNLNTEDLIVRLFDKDIPAAEISEINNILAQRQDASLLLDEYSELNRSIQSISLPKLAPDASITDELIAKINKVSEKHFAIPFWNRFKYAIVALLLLISFSTYFAYNYLQNKNSVSNTAQSNTKIGKINNQFSTSEPNESLVEKSQTIELQKSKLQASNLNNSLDNKSINDANVNTFTDKEVETTENPIANINIITFDNIAYNDYLIEQGELHIFTKYIVETQDKILDFSNFAKNRILPIFTKSLDLAKRTFTPSRLKTNNEYLIQYRNIYALSSPEAKMQGADFYYQNYNFALFLKTYDGIYFGAELGSEQYSQIFLDASLDSTYQTSPNVFYFGLNGKFELNQFEFANLKPVVNLFAGSSSLGPITRANLVAQYGIFGDRVRIFAGYEAGLLLYKNQNKWYNTTKTGIIGGINIKL